MANRPPQKGKTIAHIQRGSQSGPKSKGGPKAHSIVFNEIDRGERTVKGPGSPRMFPPVYGKQLVVNTKKSAKKTKGVGYVPSTSDITNSPKA